MIKFVSLNEVLPLRSLVLRNGKALEQSVFAGDEAESAIHLANIVDDEIISVLTFHAAELPEFEGHGFQLRGMATLPKHRGKGAGNQLLNFAITFLRGRKVNYIWCNARKAALSFYRGMGFEIISEEFIIEGIGPHRKMYLKIQ
jgi:ribosomal protein S18 acetylase RimI-like enzyme